MVYICNKYLVFEWFFYCFVFDIYKMVVFLCVFCYDKGNNFNLGMWIVKKVKLFFLSIIFYVIYSNFDIENIYIKWI